MSRTISGSYGSITLTTTADNPVYVTGTIAAIGIALYGEGNAGGTNGWTIDNSGTITGSGASGVGIQLGTAGNPVAASRISNASTGTIAGGRVGISIVGTGTITNFGTISGTGTNTPRDPDGLGNGHQQRPY